MSIAAVLLVFLGASLMVARKLDRRLRQLPRLTAISDDKPRVAQPLEAAESIYDQKLAQGWDDWGWGPHELGRVPAKVVFGGYGGILLHHAELAWRYGGVAFRYRAPASFGSFLQVTLRRAGKPDDAFSLITVVQRHIALVDGWYELMIDLEQLNHALV